MTGEAADLERDLQQADAGFDALAEAYRKPFPDDELEAIQGIPNNDKRATECVAAEAFAEVERRRAT